MTAKSIGVAFKPLVDQAKSEINAPSKIDTPDYPDQGVAFAGFSKTLISGNTYKLNPQTRFTYVLNRPSFVGTEIHDIGLPHAGKKLYISSMTIDTSISAVDASSYIRIRSMPSQEEVWRMGLIRSETIHCVFPVPLLIKDENTNTVPTGCEITISSGAATMNRCVISLQGWEE